MFYQTRLLLFWKCYSLDACLESLDVGGLFWKPFHCCRTQTLASRAVPGTHTRMGFDDRETDKRSVEVGEGGKSPLSQASSMSDNLPSVAISSLSSRSSSPSGDLVCCRRSPRKNAAYLGFQEAGSKDGPGTQPLRDYRGWAGQDPSVSEPVVILCWDAAMFFPVTTNQSGSFSAILTNTPTLRKELRDDLFSSLGLSPLLLPWSLYLDSLLFPTSFQRHWKSIAVRSSGFAYWPLHLLWWASYPISLGLGFGIYRSRTVMTPIRNVHED